VKVFLDDVREAPAGWIRCRTPDEVIVLLETGDVEELSLDHDLGLIDGQVIQGAAAEVLVGAVTSDDLLVVGSRGHGGFADVLLGSVSQQCVHHAPCPVVVVHAPKPAASGDQAAGAVVAGAGVAKSETTA